MRGPAIIRIANEYCSLNLLRNNDWHIAVTARPELIELGQAIGKFYVPLNL